MMQRLQGILWPNPRMFMGAVLACVISVSPSVTPAQPDGLKEGQAVGSISNKGKTASSTYAYVL